MMAHVRSASRRHPVADRGASGGAPPRGELAGVVHIRYRGQRHSAWYRVTGDLLTVYCGAASNSGLLPPPSPSPTPLAERLLRELIDAEHPGLNPQ